MQVAEGGGTEELDRYPRRQEPGVCHGDGEGQVGGHCFRVGVSDPVAVVCSGHKEG